MTIFSGLSAVLTSTCAMLVTAALQSNKFIDKFFSTMIHGMSAADNIAEAVEKRSKIYGDGVVANGEISEREILMKSRMRLHALERQEQAVANGTATYVPERTMTDKLGDAMKIAKEAATKSVKPVVVGSATAADASVKITSAVPGTK
jgi:hypothetical protein